MTNRNRRLLFGLLAGVTVAVSLAVWMLWPRSAITCENAAKIQKGMTLAEVEAILGGAARDESTGLLQQPDSERDGNDRTWIYFPAIDTLRQFREWVTDWLVIQVYFDDQMLVREVTFFPVQRDTESPFDMLRRWLRL
jgi:hypothetical protein